MKKIIAQLKRHKIFKVHFEGGAKRPPMELSEGAEAFYKSVKGITREIDVRISREHRWSSSDICHIPHSVLKMDGLGPVGEFLPSGNERIFRHSLSERSLMLALILKSE